MIFRIGHEDEPMSRCNAVRRRQITWPAALTAELGQESTAGIEHLHPVVEMVRDKDAVVEHAHTDGTVELPIFLAQSDPLA
jgi:hypothetical protein